MTIVLPVEDLRRNEISALFEVGGRRSTLAADHFVVVPAATPHRFESAGTAPLRLLSIQPSSRVRQTWL